MYPESERNIFTYHDGTRTRRADPMVCWRRLHDAMGGRDPGELSALTRSPDTGIRLKAMAEMAGVARDVFGLAPLDDDGAGTTEEESLAILGSFWEFSEEKKGNAASSPNGSPSTDGPPADSAATAPADVPGSTMGPITASG